MTAATRSLPMGKNFRTFLKLFYVTKTYHAHYAHSLVGVFWGAHMPALPTTPLRPWSGTSLLDGSCMPISRYIANGAVNAICSKIGERAGAEVLPGQFQCPNSTVGYGWCCAWWTWWP